jgi:hypothetical protein
MDTAAVYAKTELGLRELRERTLKLPVQMRGLLIIIDGSRTAADVLEKVKVLGLDATALEALEVGGLIARKSDAAASYATAAPPQTDEEQARLRQAQQLIGAAIDRHLGLRGYALAMRLRRTVSVDAIDDILVEFRIALSRRIGIDRAVSIIVDIEAGLDLD